jgi:hypothetical protein
VAHYGQAVITLYLAAQDLGGAGEVMAALNAAQGCAEAAVDRYESDCEAVPVGCSPSVPYDSNATE